MNKNFETPLHVMQKGHNIVHILPVLLKAGADLEARTIDGKTALMTIASDIMTHFRPEILAPLLEAGATVGARDYRGRILWLQLCARTESANTLSWLAEQGAEVHATDYLGNNTFHYLACQCQEFSDREQPKLLDDMLRRGVDPRRSNHRGQLPIHIAAGMRQLSSRGDGVDALQFLLKLNFDADVNAMDHKGLRPIHYAATVCSLQVESLLAKGADACAITADGQTILHIACRARQSNTVGLIMDIYHSENPALVNHVDQAGRTALHYACRSGRIESVNILLAAGAGTNVYDKNDLTPLDACAEFAEEDRFWSAEPRRKRKSRFTDAAGMSLEDRERPRDTRGGLWASQKEDVFGIRSIIKLLLIHGADLSPAEPEAGERNSFEKRCRFPRQRRLGYA